MPRIEGVDVPDDKRGEIALTEIYGVGQSRASEILGKAEVNHDKCPREWTESETKRVRRILEEDYTVEGQLRTEVQMNIKRLKDIGCYRGKRHREGLPVNGQRTRTNARTRKGKRKTVAGRSQSTQKK
ncbi:30S ribosomal protein S13 [Salinibacter altiplanensis]|uniref:30S ribosomal protein S13 n=1 Tax=Salinibacter altiplanensis TaxID=1803181 RepID=UPI000C9EC83D|nr:30S ribosomal protein S13 [Salinibacter altiplanensis]